MAAGRWPWPSGNAFAAVVTVRQDLPGVTKMAKPEKHRFEVRLEGENFMTNVDGDLQKFGFRARRFVEARDSLEAEKIAMILIHMSPVIKESVVNEGPDRPRIKVVGVRPINALHYLLKKSEAGFEFFAEGD